MRLLCCLLYGDMYLHRVVRGVFIVILLTPIFLKIFPVLASACLIYGLLRGLVCIFFFGRLLLANNPKAIFILFVSRSNKSLLHFVFDCATNSLRRTSISSQTFGFVSVLLVLTCGLPQTSQGNHQTFSGILVKNSQPPHWYQDFMVQDLVMDFNQNLKWLGLIGENTTTSKC